MFYNKSTTCQDVVEPDSAIRDLPLNHVLKILRHNVTSKVVLTGTFVDAPSKAAPVGQNTHIHPHSGALSPDADTRILYRE